MKISTSYRWLCVGLPALSNPRTAVPEFRLWHPHSDYIPILHIAEHHRKGIQPRRAASFPGKPASWRGQCSPACTLLPGMAWEMRRLFKCQGSKDLVLPNRAPGDFFSKDLKKAREGEDKMYSRESRRRARSSCTARPNSRKESGVTWRRVKGKAQVIGPGNDGVRETTPVGLPGIL